MDDEIVDRILSEENTDKRTSSSGNRPIPAEVGASQLEFVAGIFGYSLSIPILIITCIAVINPGIPSQYQVLLMIGLTVLTMAMVSFSFNSKVMRKYHKLVAGLGIGIFCMTLCVQTAVLTGIQVVSVGTPGILLLIGLVAFAFVYAVLAIRSHSQSGCAWWAIT